MLNSAIANLRLALECLLDDYVQIADNACRCNEYGDNEECSYCFAKRMLKETANSEVTDAQ